MSPPRLADYLLHMHQAATDACAFVEGLSLEDFRADKRTQQAVVMSLIIAGEAATRVMEQHGAFADAHPGIPWRSMRGMRNRIAHGYFEIDLDTVWETVRTALPDLLVRLQSLDPPAGPDGSNRL